MAALISIEDVDAVFVVPMTERRPSGLWNW